MLPGVPEAVIAAVLCPGPSLEEFEPAGEHAAYDLTIGVNRAAGRFACDLWVALDARTFLKTAVRGRPIIVAAADQFSLMKRMDARAGAHGCLVPLDFGPRIHHVIWHSKGLTVACMMAWAAGARFIDCYGVDWSGTADWDGHTDPKNQRTPERWEAERALFTATCGWLESQGTVVRRIEAAFTAERAEHAEYGHDGSRG
jgi:hypothetical protein